MTENRQNQVGTGGSEASRVGEHYNINRKIIASAKARHNLDAIATGGGFDYICRDLSVNPDKPVGEGFPILILHGEDCGSPDRLDEKCGVTLYLNEDWNGAWIDFKFDTCVEALDFMSGFNGTEIDFTALV